MRSTPSKKNVTEPALYAATLAALLGYRIAAKLAKRRIE